MPKILIVARQEYLRRVKSKGFIIFTLLLPAILAGYFLLIVKISQAGRNVASRLAVVDLSGKTFDELRTTLDDKLADGTPKYQLTPVDATPATLPAVRSRLQQDVLHGTFTAFLIIPSDVLQTNTAEYHAKNVANVIEIQTLQNKLRDIVTRLRLESAGVAADNVPHVLAKFDLTALKVTLTGDQEDRGQTILAAYALGTLLYMTLIIYGVTFMRSVVEEKTSRVAEVILSSVDAYTLLMGKLIGVAGAGLTQYLVWATGLALAGSYSAAMSHLAGGPSLVKYIPHLSIAVYVCFVIFFLLGFLVYAALFAAVGAIVSSDQEAQQSQMPITLLLVAGFLSASVITSDPGSHLSILLSEIPFFSPILMTMRVIISNPPFWQVALAMALCVGTILVVMKLSAKVYRVGILMTGKRPSLPELLRWMKYS